MTAILKEMILSNRLNEFDRENQGRISNPFAILPPDWPCACTTKLNIFGEIVFYPFIYLRTKNLYIENCASVTEENVGYDCSNYKSAGYENQADY